MKKFILIIVWLCNLVWLDVQADNLDSLQKLLANSTDTSRVNVLNDLSFAVVFDDANAGKNYALQALLLAQKLTYKRGIGKAYLRLGITYDVTSDFDSAIWAYDRGIEIYRTMNDAKGMASGYNNKAMVLSNNGQYQKAIDLYFMSLSAFKRINDTLGQANALNNIAVLYNDMYKHKSALKYASEALELYQKIAHKKGIAAAYTNLALAYDVFNKDTVLYYLKLAAKLKEELGDQYGLGIVYNDLGVTLTELNRVKESFAYLDKALKIKQEFDDEFGIASVLTNTAMSYYEVKNYAKHYSCLVEALSIAEKLKNNRLLSRITISLANNRMQLGNWKDAYYYLSLHKTYRDSMLNEDNDKKMAELEVKYELEKKDLKIANDSLLLKNAEVKAMQSSTRISLLSFIIVALILAGTLWWVIISTKQKVQLQNEKLAQETLRNKAIILAEDQERTRIARDLHDSAGQLLSAVRLRLSATQHTNDTLTYLDKAIQEIRQISHAMMPIALVQGNLKNALEELVNTIPSNLHTHLQVVNLPLALDLNMQSAIYRIAQECLANSIKHAQASEISIQLIGHDSHLNFMYEDNGVGFHLNTPQIGLGMQSIKARAIANNGHLEIDTAPGKGITISIDFIIKSEH